MARRVHATADEQCRLLLGLQWELADELRRIAVRPRSELPIVPRWIVRHRWLHERGTPRLRDAGAIQDADIRRLFALCDEPSLSGFFGRAVAEGLMYPPELRVNNELRRCVGRTRDMEWRGPDPRVVEVSIANAIRIASTTPNDGGQFDGLPCRSSADIVVTTIEHEFVHVVLTRAGRCSRHTAGSRASRGGCSATSTTATGSEAPPDDRCTGRGEGRDHEHVRGIPAATSLDRAI
jgi:hypothetical protein